MDNGKITFVICLTAFLVIGINAALIVALRRGNETGQIELLRRATRRARQPWGDEEKALAELSQRVAGLKSLEDQPDRQDKAENDHDR